MTFIVLIAIVLVAVLLFSSIKKEKMTAQLDDNIKLTETLGGEDLGQEEVLTKKQMKEQKLDADLKRAGFPLTAKEFIRIKLMFTLLVVMVLLVFTQNFGLAALMGGGSFFFPNVLIKIGQDKKKNALEAQIPAALSLVKNSLESGLSFLQALEIVADEMDPPISEEFARVLHETKVGKDLDVALSNMVYRVQSDELKLVVTAVLIHSQVGGNLVDILDVILETINDRIQIKGEIKTLTAQGKMSAMIISFLPVFLGILMYFMNPEYMQPLFTDPLGQLMLGGGVVFMVLGVICIMKIVNIDF